MNENTQSESTNVNRNHATDEARTSSSVLEKSKLKSTAKSMDSLNEYATEVIFKKEKVAREGDDTSLELSKNTTALLNQTSSSQKTKNLRFKVNFFRRKETDKQRALDELEKSLLKPSPALPIVKFDSDGDFFKEPNKSESPFLIRTLFHLLSDYLFSHVHDFPGIIVHTIYKRLTHMLNHENDLSQSF